MTNPIHAVQEHGQSIWYDMISRDLVRSGELARMVEQDGILGVTSNPALFEKAIGGSSDYDEQLRELVEQQGIGEPVCLFEALAIADIQQGCDVLRGVHDRTGGVDGYVSLEVSPYLANDTEGTIEEARRLWAAVDRKNLMIKVPATPEGIPAVATLIGEGINVNVTLLFAVEAYAAVADAYVEGLERFAASGGDVSTVSSVASFFVSRIDAVVDGQLASRLESETDPAVRAKLEGLQSKIAIANAVMAYAHFDSVVASDRWQALAKQGALPQRVLWASTGTKSPSLPRTLYVDALIGQHTVNTIPAATLEAFRTEGTVRDALGEDKEAAVAEARGILATLDELGISLKEITDDLLPKGCQLFCDAFDTLLGTVAERRAGVLGPRLAQLDAKLGSSAEGVERELDQWRARGYVRRLWAQDASLWSSGDEASWLGWLGALEHAAPLADDFAKIAERARSEDIRHVVVMGMGGSSLCPDVLSRTFGAARGYPELIVLDSTVPSQLAAVEARIELAHSLFIVPSKSGGTIEPNSFKAYFWDRVET
ncbi:MAG: bifunctional transaldolase/phosoglucose isomerase, partial [Myxococcota bacterium]|nr:bifunctional transaldolase/phosoglucose isomerase [Myxococcota bacterium]